MCYISPNGNTFIPFTPGDLGIRLRMTNECGGVPQNINIGSLPLKSYPNPSCDTVFISFKLGAPYRTKLVVYNVKGEQITILVDRYLREGYHNFIWNRTQNNFARTGAGIYFIQLETIGLWEEADRINKEIIKVVIL
jgi:hypothetical protein